MCTTALVAGVFALGVQVCGHPAEAQNPSSQPGDVPAQADRLLKQRTTTSAGMGRYSWSAWRHRFVTP
jgi:hypothetical protein